MDVLDIVKNLGFQESELADTGEKMNYQVRGLQFSLLIHSAIFLLITNTGISESRLSQLS